MLYIGIMKNVFDIQKRFVWVAYYSCSLYIKLRILLNPDVMKMGKKLTGSPHVLLDLQKL